MIAIVANLLFSMPCKRRSFDECLYYGIAQVIPSGLIVIICIYVAYATPLIHL